MALIDDLLKGSNVVTGLVMAAAAVIALPFFGPLIRPVAKTAIKGGIMAYREATKLYEGTAREIGDLAREAMEELGPELAKEAVTEVATDVAKEAVTEVGPELVEEAL